MGHYGIKFSDMPILSTAIDDWEQFNNALQNEGGFDLAAEVDSYKRDVYDSSISKLYQECTIPMNLGGSTEKSRLVATEKSLGVFDFSLASKGLYKMSEYYSQDLFDLHPNKFESSELPSGVVPPNLVKEKFTRGIKEFYYEDKDGIFECVLRQKGATAIDQHIPNARLKFGTKTKKVFLTFKRDKGKVKYVEIYSLFYFTRMERYNDVQYAIRHMPAIMVCDYLESIGIKTRFYMTRFVKLTDETHNLREYDKDINAQLPMYERYKSTYNKTKSRVNLLFQPIIAKDFGEDFNKELGFMVSSYNFRNSYERFARYTIKKETYTDIADVYGEPNFEEKDYREGFERYRNKYQEYVEKGIFKSKEVQPEAMLFFHDLVLNQRLSYFMDSGKKFLNIATGSTTDADYLINKSINPFFVWWMRISAINLKSKIELINARDYVKELATINNDLERMVDEFYLIIKYIDPKIKNKSDTLQEYLRDLGETLLKEYKIFGSDGKYNFKTYIRQITDDISIYADGAIYESTKETIEEKDKLTIGILEALKNY